MNKRASLMNKRASLPNIRMLFGKKCGPFLVFLGSFFMPLTSNFVVFLSFDYFF